MLNDVAAKSYEELRAIRHALYAAKRLVRLNQARPSQKALRYTGCFIEPELV